MEGLVVLSAGILVYCLIVGFLLKTGEQADAVKRRLESISRGSGPAFLIDEELVLPLVDRLIKPMLKTLAEKCSRRWAETGEDSAKSKRLIQLKRTLIQAGFTISTAEFRVIRLFVIFGAFLLFGGAEIALKAPWQSVMLAFLTGPLFGYTGIRLFLSVHVTKRRQQIEKQLPEVLDLLSVSVEAGLGFEQSIGLVVKNMEGPLIDELTVTSREMAMGRPRKDALILLGERCGLDEVKAFVGAVVQAGQLGISIKNVLQSQSAAMRQARKARIQEMASKISVKILIPMVMFIFPVIFIVLLGPAVISILKALG